MDARTVTRLASHDYARGPAPLEADELAGRAVMLDALRARDRRRLEGAARIVCASGELADAVRALGVTAAVAVDPAIDAADDAIAAPREFDDSFWREVYGAQQLPWVRSLITNNARAEPDRYTLWRRVHHDNEGRRSMLARRAARLGYRPLFSVVVPVHNPEPGVLDALVQSVCDQIYDRWELVLVDDGSTRDGTAAALDVWAQRAGIVLVRRDAPGGIAAATNDGLARARGQFVAFADHDDVLAPEALYWIARRLERDPTLDVVYTDEDKLDEHGRRVEPFFKPAWSPDYLLSVNYITHLLVVRRSLLTEVGGLRAGFDGAQDYDLLLRLTERTDRIGHVPAPVYSWRKTAGSTAADIANKPAAHRASERALDEAIARRGLDAERLPGLQPTWHRVRYRIHGTPLVSVVIPTRDRIDLLRPCVERVRATVAREFELVVVDNESRDPDTLAYLDELSRQPRVRVVAYPHRFNFARQINLAAACAQGELLLLLNNDARPVDDGWFDALLEHAQRPEVGAVGARLRWPGGRAQHEGVVLNAGGVALNLDSGPYAVYGDCIRNVTAVTAACMMLRAEVFEAVGGMDERLRVAYNDVDLCRRIGQRGWRIIYTPYAELVHSESSTRGTLHPEIDEDFYQSKWGPPYTALDPCYTPNLELMQPWSPRL